MKNYYCLISIGEVSGIENTLSSIVNGKHHHINLGKLFISTFESDFSIWEIEQILVVDKRSIFLTKMEPTNFTANIKDTKIQNDLFLDFVLKMINFNPSKEEKEILNIEDITLDDNNDQPNEKEFFIDLRDELNRLKSFKKRTNKSPKNKEKYVQPTLDDLLDKISKVGYDKLNSKEKDLLDQYSKNQ